MYCCKLFIEINVLNLYCVYFFLYNICLGFLFSVLFSFDDVFKKYESIYSWYLYKSIYIFLVEVDLNGMNYVEKKDEFYFKF